RQLLTDRSERPINFFSRHRDIHLHHAHPSSGRSNSVCSQTWDWIRVASCPLTPGMAGDVVQLVRTLFSNRHINVSDLKIRNLEQKTSGRLVTEPSSSPNFQNFLSVLLNSFATFRFRCFVVCSFV